MYQLILDGETHLGGGEEIGDMVLTDDFGLTLDEFSEVQDLTLADLVHDVDVEQGWPIFKKE